MRIVKPLKLGALTRNFVSDGRFWLSVGAACHFAFDAPDELLGEQEMWSFLPGELGASVIFDEGRPKARGEVLLLGSGYTYGDEPVSATVAEFELGQARGQVALFGDRAWRPRGAGMVWDATPPQPFRKLRIAPESGYGGEGYQPNLAGKGHLPQGAQPDAAGRTPLPNLEVVGRYVTDPWAVPPPAGFFPLSPMDPERQALYGTIDNNWVHDTFPADPRGTNPEFYNVAPASQRIAGFWRGGERFVCTNMHPEDARLEGRLPEQTVRCFVTIEHDAGQQEWREVPTVVETVWLFPDAQKGVVLHRGCTEVNSFDGHDVSNLVLGYEQAGGESRESGEYRAALQRRLDEDTALVNMARQDDLSPPEVARAEAQAREQAINEASSRAADPAPMPPELVQAEAEAKARLNQQVDLAREQAAEVDVDLDKEMEQQFQDDLAKRQGDLDEILPLLKEVGVEVNVADYQPSRALETSPSPTVNINPPPVNSMADVGPALAFAEQLGAKLELISQKSAALIDKLEQEGKQKQDVVDQDARELAAEFDIDYDQKVAEAKLGGGPDPFAVVDQAKTLAQTFGEHAPTALAQVAAAGTELEAHRGEIAKATAMAGGEGPNPATDPELKPMMLQLAHHAPPPEARSEQASAAAREQAEASLSSGADIGALDLSGVSFAGVSWPGRNLRYAVLTGADFRGADLSGVDMTGAILAHANLEGAILAGAVMRGTSVGNARLKGADLSGVDLTRGIISGADLSDAVLAGAVLSEAELVHRAAFCGADMSEVTAPGLTFVECDLSGTVLVGADLTKCSLLRCCLEKADLSTAKLAWCTVAEARASACKLLKVKGKHLAVVLQSDMTGADMSGADLEAANLGETALGGVVLSGATLDRANLSQADLSGAVLSGASARDARFDYATMTDLVATQANFWGASMVGASLDRADLRGAHLRDTNALYATAAGVQLEGATLVRCRLDPRQGRSA